MAGFCGLKILLLWTGFIVLTNCQLPSPGGPSCSYSVTPIQYGLKFEIRDSPPGTYHINIEEAGKRISLLHNVTSSEKITFLKPCTEYKHSVTFIVTDGKNTSCTSAENRTKTLEMNDTEVKSGNCSKFNDQVCYQSEWDISSSLSHNISKVNGCPNDNQVFCFKPKYDDICSILTTTFQQPSASCSSFTKTEYISPEKYLLPGKIPQNLVNALPANITATLPKHCENVLKVEYICLEHGQSGSYIKLKDVLPFTKYSCIGQIQKNDNVTIKKTTSVDVKVECDLRKNVTQWEVTDTSITWIGEIKSTNCSKLSDYGQLSYTCSCMEKPHPHSRGQHDGTCTVSGLTPATSYNCHIQPTFNGKKVGNKEPEPNVETNSGIPEDIKSITVTNPENNEIKINCTHIQNFKGRMKTYKMTFFDGEVKKDLKSENKCTFHVKDLSYLTTYKVELVAFNGKYTSHKPLKQEVSTLYNDKALIGFLVFLIILTSVALLIVVYKIYILKRRSSQ